VIAIKVLQQQYPFPNVRRIFAPHKAPGVFELCFLRNIRRMQLFVVHSFEFLKRNHDSCHKMMQHSCTLHYISRSVRHPDFVSTSRVSITTRSRNERTRHMRFLWRKCHIRHRVDSLTQLLRIHRKYTRKFCARRVLIKKNDTNQRTKYIAQINVNRFDVT